MKGNVNKGSLFTSCIMNCSSCLNSFKKKRIVVALGSLTLWNLNQSHEIHTHTQWKRLILACAPERLHVLKCGSYTAFEPKKKKKKKSPLSMSKV